MKKVSILLVLVLILLSFTSCTEDSGVSAEELMREITSSYKNIPPCRAELRFGAEMESRSYLSHKLAGIIYYGKKSENVRELNLLSDFVIRLPDDQSAFEIHVLKVKNLSNREEVIELCQRRIKMLQKSEVYLYVPEAYEENIAGATVYTKGNFVILLITPDNQKAINAIERKI